MWLQFYGVYTATVRARKHMSKSFNCVNMSTGTVTVYPDTGAAVTVQPRLSSTTPSTATFSAQTSCTLHVTFLTPAGEFDVNTVYVPVLYASATQYFPTPQQPTLIADFDAASAVLTVFSK